MYKIISKPRNQTRALEMGSKEFREKRYFKAMVRFEKENTLDQKVTLFNENGELIDHN